jgi:hypothetical protein
MTALIAAPDITSVDQMSYYAWPTAFVALPVALFWLLPFFLASDVIDGGIALQSGLLAATARRSPPKLPATSPWDALAALAKYAAHQTALSRAKMALEVEAHEEDSLNRPALPSFDTPFAVDSSHEPGMACVEFYDEDDMQLHWVCV